MSRFTLYTEQALIAINNKIISLSSKRNGNGVTSIKQSGQYFSLCALTLNLRIHIV